MLADDVYLSVAQTIGSFVLDDGADPAEQMDDIRRRAEGEARAFLDLQAFETEWEPSC